MNKQFLRFAFSLLISLTLPLAATAQVVNLPDPNLRAAIENALGKSAGASITVDEMATLARLDAPEADIRNLTGLEHATNLTKMFLWDNNISNISPVTGLTKLTELVLGGNTIMDISPVAGLINLTYLHLPGNSIVDISAVSDLTQLMRLNLAGTHISDISPVASLTNLARLELRYNNISDISPLVANTGLGSGDKVVLNDNPLSSVSIKTHIPALQNRGVTVEFDDRLPITPASIDTDGMVRLVYFLPSDRPARPERMTTLRQLIKDAQQFYADEMQRHGFGRTTFTVETDADGEPLVHQVNGKFKEEYYYQLSSIWHVWAELPEYFEADDFQHVYFIVIDLSYEGLDGGTAGGLAALIYPPSGGRGRFHLGGRRNITQGEEVFGGLALIPWSSHNFERLGITVHEIGHAFGLVHDFRRGRHSNYVLAAGKQNRLSKCAAEWLSVSRFFNTKSIFHNEPGKIQLLSLQPYSKDVISFRFEVTDPDGLHQVQLLVPEIYKGTGEGPFQLFDCKRLNGKTGTVEFAVRTAELVDRIGLQIIDVRGNITWATFPIDLDAIAPAQNALDVNGDGVVNILDLTPIAAQFGQHGKDTADVNKDGIVDIVDVLLVAAHIPNLSQQAVEMFTEAHVQQWLTHAKQFEVENEILQKGIVELERLLAVLTAVTVDIPDPNLRAAVEPALRVSPGTPIVSSEMETLTRLDAGNANISDLTGLEHATNLTELSLGDKYVEGQGHINSNSIKDLSPLAELSNLTSLNLSQNNISDLSPLAELANLTWLDVGGNNLSNISPVAELINLTALRLWRNNIVDVSPVADLIHLTELNLHGNNIADLSPLAKLTSLTKLQLGHNSISDLSPLLTNTGLGSGDTVNVQHNPLSYQSIHTHIPELQSRGVTVEFDNRAHPALLKISGDNQKGASFALLSQPFVVEAQDANGSALGGISVTFAVVAGGGTLSTTSTRTSPNGRAQSTLILGPNLGANTVSVSATGIESPATFHAIADTLPTEFLWSIPHGISLIHVPLRVTAVRGVETTITSISDLYDVLGGANAVQFLITYDSQAQDWRSYFGASDTSADVRLANDTGIIANLKASASLHLSGTPLRTGGSGAINLNQGFNLVGLPLRDPRIQRVSDLLTLEEIGGNVPVIILTDGDTFTLVGRAGDPGDIAITGGQGFIMTAQRAATVTLSGDGWYNAADPSAAPQVALKGIEVKHTTPVLALRGAVVDKGAGLKVPTFRVTVKNLSTGRAVATAATPDEAGYQLTVVDIETARAATVGDLLEIVVKSPDPSVGIQPLRYTVTAEDVKRSYIQLPDLVAYEIPTETELLTNYPNPFNPETWIPYRLAEDAFVTLTIYDGSGQVVRFLNVGYRIAAAYEHRSKAIYWDGRNALGEQVASGVYFYTLTAGDYSATRKMLILK